MLIPNNVSLDELVRLLQDEIKSGTSKDAEAQLLTYLNILEVVKRELDKKQDKAD